MGSRSRDRGGGSAGGPVAELSLPRFAILTAVCLCFLGSFLSAHPPTHGGIWSWGVFKVAKLHALPFFFLADPRGSKSSQDNFWKEFIFKEFIFCSW